MVVLAAVMSAAVGWPQPFLALEPDVYQHSEQLGAKLKILSTTVDASAQGLQDSLRARERQTQCATVKCSPKPPKSISRDPPRPRTVVLYPILLVDSAFGGGLGGGSVAEGCGVED